MAIELSVVDGVDASTGTVRLPRDAMDTLGVSSGDVVTVEGRRRTAARVSDALEGDFGLAAAESVRENAGLEAGERATVAAAAAVEASSVAVAPPEGLGFEGDSSAVERLLRGRPVTRGDAVHASLFGGSLDVTFTVTDVAPEEPAVVVDTTAIRVDGDPARPATTGGVGRARSVTYDDVGGLDAELRRLRQLVEVPLERPALYEQLGGRPPNGVLVHGPTGVGKTLVVDALGNEVDASFVRVGDPGSAADRFASLADRARTEAPAVVFVDDVDAVAPADDGQGSTAMRSFMDAVADENVVVVGATTRPDDVDPSLRRGGRFDHELELGTPDREDRLDVLRTHTRDLRLSDDVDLRSVAERTHGYVGADLLALVREAVQHAVGRLPEAVQFGERRVSEGELAGLAVTAADVEAGLEEVTPGGMREVRVEHPDVTYADIGGVTEAKREVIRAVEWPLRYPELFDHLGNDAATGILLHGLPGTGKTMLARAVANATEANFVAVNGPELLDRYVGESERGVREVFERARRHSPAVVFFDELDALAPVRGGDSDAEVIERVVSQLLTELDGVEPRENVVVIGATNRPDMIDRALLRPGRLEKVVEVPLPDREARREIFDIHARPIPSEAVDFEDFADRTEGYTGSDIEAVVREASLRAMEEYLGDRSFEFDPERADLSALTVRREHFEAAVENVTPSVTERMRKRYAERAEELTR